MNEYGLDYAYFEKKLKIISKNCSRYTPDEMARELARLSVAADEAVLLEKEFNIKENSNVQKSK